MKHANLTMPEIMLLAGTRVALGAGLGLLVATSIDSKQRKAIGWGLFMLGAATTVPLVRHVLGKLE